jgi:hypothetical protein
MSASKLETFELDRFLGRAELVAQLMAHPGWGAWEELLGDMRAAMMEQLAQCEQPNEFRYWQGAVHALGEMIDRPKRVVAAATQTLAAEEEEKRVRPEIRALVGAGLDYEGDI